MQSPGNTLATNPVTTMSAIGGTGSFSKSQAFGFKHGTPTEREAGNSVPPHHSPTKMMQPRTPKVIRGFSAYGNFLADATDNSDIKVPQASTENWQSGRESSFTMGGRDSSLSMVSDYTLSYGLDALEADKLVANPDGRFVPAYVALDRKVLRFHAYFRDDRDVRKATLLHYLEDGSTRVSEKRSENSGIVTGEIARRHRVPKPDGGFYAIEDFDVGSEIEVFARAYTIIDMDEFTREFYSLNGIPRKDAIGMPQDHVELPSQLPRTIDTFPDVIFSTHDTSNRFIALDKKVLRFYCSWKDDKPYGEERFYNLHYYLVDDTVQLTEIQQRNDGRDHWSCYLRRGPLLKELPRQQIQDDDDLKNDPQPRWHWTDIRVGEMITVYHRNFLILDCDAFTRDWIAHHDKEQPDPVQPEIVATPEFKRKIPPHVASPGSHEDSYQSVLNPLTPKPLKKDFVKAIANDAKVMRFQAKLISDYPEDKGRLFILSFFLVDDTLLIYERPTRNTFAGLRSDGSKFLERSQVRHPDGPHSPLPRYYTAEDVQSWDAGSRMTVNGHVFEIEQGDNFTRSLQAGGGISCADPRKNLIFSQISDQLRRVAVGKADQFEYFDRNDDGIVTPDELFVTLKLLGIRLSEAEVCDLIAEHDFDGDGALNSDEFFQMLKSTHSLREDSIRNPGKVEKLASTQAGLSFPQTSRVLR